MTRFDLFSYLLLFRFNAQPELPHRLRPGKLAAVVVHAPGAPERETGAALVGIEALAGACSRVVGGAPAVGRQSELVELVG